MSKELVTAPACDAEVNPHNESQDFNCTYKYNKWTSELSLTLEINAAAVTLEITLHDYDTDLDELKRICSCETAPKQNPSPPEITAGVWSVKLLNDTLHLTSRQLKLKYEYTPRSRAIMRNVLLKALEEYERTIAYSNDLEYHFIFLRGKIPGGKSKNIGVQYISYFEKHILRREFWVDVEMHNYAYSKQFEDCTIEIVKREINGKPFIILYTMLGASPYFCSWNSIALTMDFVKKDLLAHCI